MSECIYILDYCDYPECGGGPDLRAAYGTEQAAVDALIARFPSPYRVVWEDIPRDAQGGRRLRGEFKRVQGFSTEHVSTWEIVAVPVVAA